MLDVVYTSQVYIVLYGFIAVKAGHLGNKGNSQGGRMASQYSHLQFFRRVPNALLADYFESQGAALGIDWGELGETDGEPILRAFSKLAADKQSEIEAEFQDVHALACDGGIGALVDEAAFHRDAAFVDAMEAVEGFHAKVMWAFLKKPSYWRGATMFLHADNVAPSYWKKRNDLPSIAPQVEPKDITALATAVSGVFSKEGRGKNCKVEPYRRHEKEYFFAYPEDFAQSGVEWVSNTLKTLAHHPAFEIIFVYCEAEGSLDIYAPKNGKAVPELQKIFAKAILKLDTLADGTIDKRVYNLEPLADANFEFKFSSESGINKAVVTKMRLTLKSGSRRRIQLEADTGLNSMAVYDLLKELKPPPYLITLISIKVIFETAPGKRARTKTFNITYPNSCNLNHEGKDGLIRGMLAASGIEPHAPRNNDNE